jgi:hypothetical protein
MFETAVGGQGRRLGGYAGSDREEPTSAGNGSCIPPNVVLKDGCGNRQFK